MRNLHQIIEFYSTFLRDVQKTSMKDVPVNHNILKNKCSDTLKLFIPKRWNILEVLMKRPGRRYPWQFMEKTQNRELYEKPHVVMPRLNKRKYPMRQPSPPKEGVKCLNSQTIKLKIEDKKIYSHCLTSNLIPKHLTTTIAPIWNRSM